MNDSKIFIKLINLNILDFKRHCEPQGIGAIAAASRGDSTLLKCMIDQGCDVNEQSEGGESALSWSCINDNFDYASLLCENGADINILGDDEWTPLDCTPGHASQEFIDWFRSIGAKNW